VTPLGSPYSWLIQTQLLETGASGNAIAATVDCGGGFSNNYAKMDANQSMTIRVRFVIARFG